MKTYEKGFYWLRLKHSPTDWRIGCPLHWESRPETTWLVDGSGDEVKEDDLAEVGPYLGADPQAFLRRQHEEALTCLNTAFAADPQAIRALMVNQVPCNWALAEHPTVVVDCDQQLRASESVPLELRPWVVRALGLMNGVLEAMGLPKVAVQFEPREERNVMLGFVEYQPELDDIQYSAEAIITQIGSIEKGIPYHLAYRCSTPGPEVEEGFFSGQWTGEIDNWGKLTFCSAEGKRIYLFPYEITSLTEDESSN